jgi:hypothetical protein
VKGQPRYELVIFDTTAATRRSRGTFGHAAGFVSRAPDI